MAIKIPSKNIYEMNNPKIRDNVIDNVSVEQTVVTPNNEYEVNVFSQELNKYTFAKEEKSSNSVTNLDTLTNGYPLIASAVKIVDEYTKINIKIKKLKENSVISRLYNSKSELTNENITKIEKVFDEVEYNLIEIDDGFSFAIYDNTIQNSSFNVDLRNINETKSSKRINNPTSKIVTFNFSNTADYSNINRIFFGGNIQYELGNLVVENEESNQNTIHSTTKSPFNERTANSSISIETQEQDLSSLTIREDEDYFYVESNPKGVLTKRIYYAFMSGVYTKDLQNGTHSFPCNVLKVEQKAVSAIITIYGDTIGIDLTNGSILCGSGTKPHSLSGNELLQDSATTNGVLTTEFIANNVLEQYSKGKETSTLLCSISDYYDYETNELLISDKKLIETPNVTYSIDMVDIGVGYRYNYYITFDIGKTYNEDVEIDYTYIFTKKENIENTYSRNDKITIRKGQKSTSKHILESEYEYNISVDTNAITQASLPMIFENHSQVIPYVFGADGQDKPMSKYQDGSPKVFEVVGSNIIYDGAVWQELTLLEKQKTNS